MALVRQRRGDRGRHRPEERWLPGEVGVELVAETVCGAAVGPVDEQLRSLGRVRREQPGDPAGHRVAATLTELGLVRAGAVAEVLSERRRPRLVEAVVKDGEHRPGEGVRCPGVLVSRACELADQGPWGPELHTRAHAVTGAWASGAEQMGEPLRQPALDAARRHEHDLLRERVLERRGEQLAEGVGELVGARSAMEVEH